jgi:SRSO17 transposase
LHANLLVGAAVVEEVKMLAVAGLSAQELARVRGRLVEFADEMFASMARKDQRRWGECYLRGLMLDGKGKSIEPMAARLEDGDEQCLQQFVNQSPWDSVPVRRAVARRTSRELGPEACVIDDTGFSKFAKVGHALACTVQRSVEVGEPIDQKRSPWRTRCRVLRHLWAK